jgi:hypothetical protein
VDRLSSKEKRKILLHGDSETETLRSGMNHRNLRGAVGEPDSPLGSLGAGEQVHAAGQQESGWQHPWPSLWLKWLSSSGFRASVFVWLWALLGIPTLLGANLVECPDCGKEVSRRAVSCPHCGSPGSAIAEVVRRKEEDKKPKAVLQIKAAAATGLGLAVEENGVRYVVLPVAAAGTADTLNLRTIQGAELPYSRLEVAREVSLIRFRVAADTLAYLRPSKEPGDTPPTLLGSLGLPLAAATPEADRPFARLGADGGVVAMNVGGSSGDQWVALNQPIAWEAVEPSHFRAQAGLLARLALHPASEPLSGADRTALESADWICRDFRTRAQKLLKPVSSTPQKKP